MLCDRQFQYTLVLLYICVKTHNVHRNKKCSVFQICLFSERFDFCDCDIGCSCVSTNFVKHRTRFYWILKRKPNIHVSTRGWVMEFPTLLQGWVSHFCAEGRGWAICFLSTTFPNAPAHPTPPPNTFSPVLNTHQCAKGTRAVPGKQKASIIDQLVVDNSTNKIFVFGKGKNCFHGPKISSS